MLRTDQITRVFLDTRSATAVKISQIPLEEYLLELIGNDVRTFGLVASQQEWEYVNLVLANVKATSLHDVEALRKATKQYIKKP